MITITTPIELVWVENTNPRYVEGLERLVFAGSTVALFEVYPITSGLPFCKKTVTWRYLTEMKNPKNDIRIGGTFNTKEEAKARAEEIAKQILQPRK